MNKGVTLRIENFTDLDAWKEGHKLVLLVYKLTESFPNKEIFGLVNQCRRAVVSITASIAEGFSRRSSKEKVQFYSFSLGSITELQNQLLICRDVGYLNSESFDKLYFQSVKVHKIVNGLIKSSRIKIHTS